MLPVKPAVAPEENPELHDDAALAALPVQFANRELENIGLDRVARLEKIYGPKDMRVRRAKLDAFFRAYAILGTVRYAAQVCGLNPTAVKKVIKNSPRYAERFDLAHEEFVQYLEQTAVSRALAKSDQLLMFLLRANNPRKFSERLRLQAMSQDSADNAPVQLVFGEATGDEPNYALESASTDTNDDELGEAPEDKTQTQ